MKTVILAFVFTICTFPAFSQDKAASLNSEVFVLPITDYVVDINDTIKTVQIFLENNVTIQLKKLGILKGNYNYNKDTATVGMGRCQLIKGKYFYFAIKINDKERVPQKGDLLYTFVDYPVSYKSKIYELTRYHIYLQSIQQQSFFDFYTALSLNKESENELFKNMAADVRYTAKKMKEQADNQNQSIKGGIFEGMKLFDAMETVNEKHVKKFINFVISRPKKYIGNTWNFSEVFATWMINSTPDGD